MSTALAQAPLVESGRIRFTYVDADGELEAVRLVHDLVRPRVLDFARSDETTWELDFPRPDADRMEYQLELVGCDNDSELVCDPANPLRAPGPFGEKSVLEFEGYEPPAWTLEPPVPAGTLRRIELRSPALRATVGGLAWSSAGAGAAEPLPLLVAHDGPEYANYSELLRLLDHAVDRGALPPMRAALLAPVDRNQTYSASAVYARALARDLLPALVTQIPTDRRLPVVGMGASLGALALLHAHRAYPNVFGALFLQSGSFFRQRFDQQESGFVRFRRISRFVGQVLAAEEWDDPIPLAMTCGTAEENLANNRAAAQALAAQGYAVTFHENRDAHNWIAWRDTFDPHLVSLLSEAWS